MIKKKSLKCRLFLLNLVPDWSVSVWVSSVVQCQGVCTVCQASYGRDTVNMKIKKRRVLVFVSLGE